MGRLSHIDDFKEQETPQQEAASPAKTEAEPMPDPKPVEEPAVEYSLGDYKMPIIQKVLIVAAAIVLIAAVVYVANYSLHFF